DERPYWEAKSLKAQDEQKCEIPASSSSHTKANDEGFLSKLSVVDIGSVCGNLAKNVGDQAKLFGDQAKVLGDQAKGYTLANTTTAAAAMDRFKKKIVAAVDGVPVRPDEASLRESGATTNVELDAACEALLLVESKETEQRSCSGEEDGEGGEEDRDTRKVQEQNEPLKDSAKESTAGSTSVATGKSKRRDLLLNGGMVDESGPVLSFGAVAAAFKKKSAGGAAIANSAGEDGPVVAASSNTPSDGSSADAYREGQPPGGNGDPASMKILPRTASLVGGKQWAVMSAVYDTTASIIDETVGDLFT
ncbi:unnamed protein product, partial [Scytosiphon promiscuus]